MRRLARWIVPVALLAALLAAGLEVQGQVRRAEAHSALLSELQQALRSPGEPAVTAGLAAAQQLAVHGRDAGTAALLTELAQEQPTALHWHLVAQAETWNGDREPAAAQAAQQAARLAPLDTALRAGEERALDAVLLGRMRTVTRPVGAVSGGLLCLALLRRLARRGCERRRRRWAQGATAQVLGSVDGRGTPAGQPVDLPADARHVNLDVFLAPSTGCPRPSRQGPTLSVLLSSARESRTVRLTPVKDVRQDAIRVRLSESTLALLRAHPGRWRATVALDGAPVAEALLEVGAPARRAAAG